MASKVCVCWGRHANFTGISSIEKASLRTWHLGWVLHTVSKLAPGSGGDGRWKARRGMLGNRGEGRGQKALDCKQLQQRDFTLDFYWWNETVWHILVACDIFLFFYFLSGLLEPLLDFWDRERLQSNHPGLLHSCFTISKLREDGQKTFVNVCEPNKESLLLPWWSLANTVSELTSFFVSCGEIMLSGETSEEWPSMSFQPWASSMADSQCEGGKLQV